MPAATKSTESLVERLKKNLSGYYSAEAYGARAKNPAIPFDALEVHDWPMDLQYAWVPAPGGMSPSVHGMSEMANLRAAFIQKGWQFYPAQDFRSEPDTGFPWLSVWEDDSNKVRAMDHWLMYADRDMEARKRAENLRRWNDKRESKRESAVEMNDSNRTRDVVESRKGRTSVAELLKEGDSDN